VGIVGRNIGECDARQIRGNVVPALSEHGFEPGTDGAVSELGSAVEPYRCESLAELPDARIEEEFAELHRVGELIELERRAGSRRSSGAACSSATGTGR
jgi:hypothetical protein